MRNRRSTTFTPESPQDPAHTTVLQSSNEEKNGDQIEALLRIQAEARMMLISSPDVGATENIDEEAQKAASSTYTAAAHQLRNLLDDQARWTLAQNAVDAKTEAVMDLKIQEHKSRIELQAKQKAPSALYRVQLRKMVVDGGLIKWVCWLGDQEPKQNDVHGFGSSPAEATANFDAAFTRIVEQLAHTPTPAPLPEKPGKSTRKKR